MGQGSHDGQLLCWRGTGCVLCFRNCQPMSLETFTFDLYDCISAGVLVPRYGSSCALRLDCWRRCAFTHEFLAFCVSWWLH